MLTTSHPESRASFYLLEWGGEKKAPPESLQTFEVAAAKTFGLINLVLSRQTGVFEGEHPYLDKVHDGHNRACCSKHKAFRPRVRFSKGPETIIAQLLAHNPVNFASLTDINYIIFKIIGTFILIANTKQFFRPESFSGLSRNRPLVRWLITKKHFPESKNTSQNLDSGKCLWILGRVLDSGKCFGFWDVFLDSGKCFWILESVLDAGKCFWILGSVLSLRATVPWARNYLQARCRTCSLSSWLNKDLTRFTQSLSRVPRQNGASERKAPLEGIQLIQEILLVHKLRTKKVKTSIWLRIEKIYKICNISS